MTSSNILPLLTLVLVMSTRVESQWSLSAMVNCTADGVYPSFSTSNCQQYIECKNGLSTVMTCPSGESTDRQRVQEICGESCGYKCGSELGMKVISFTPPRTDTDASSSQDSSYYGVCVDGQVIAQSRCPTPANDLFMSYYNQDEKECVLKTKVPCTDGLVDAIDCSTSYFDCIGGELNKIDCPPGLFFETSANGCTVRDCDATTTVQPDGTTIIPTSATAETTSTGPTSSTIAPNSFSKTPQTTTSAPIDPSNNDVPTRRRTTPRRY